MSQNLTDRRILLWDVISTRKSRSRSPTTLNSELRVLRGCGLAAVARCCWHWIWPPDCQELDRKRNGIAVTHLATCAGRVDGPRKRGARSAACVMSCRCCGVRDALTAPA